VKLYEVPAVVEREQREADGASHEPDGGSAADEPNLGSVEWPQLERIEKCRTLDDPTCCSKPRATYRESNMDESNDAA